MYLLCFHSQVLPRKVTTEEQGEILNMLCKVHELEVESILLLLVLLASSA